MLPVAEQLLLVEIIKQRLIQHRRAELMTVIAEARAAYHTRHVQRGALRTSGWSRGTRG